MEGPAEYGNNSTVEEFREYFEKVSKKRYEVDPAMTGGVIERVRDLSGCKKKQEKIMNV